MVSIEHICYVRLTTFSHSLQTSNLKNLLFNSASRNTSFLMYVSLHSVVYFIFNSIRPDFLSCLVMLSVFANAYKVDQRISIQFCLKLCNDGLNYIYTLLIDYVIVIVIEVSVIKKTKNICAYYQAKNTIK